MIACCRVKEAAAGRGGAGGRGRVVKWRRRERLPSMLTLDEEMAAARTA